MIRDESPPPTQTEPGDAAPAAAPQVKLPRKLPLQIWRPVQSNIPPQKAERERIKAAAVEVVAEERLVPPVTMDDIRRYGRILCERAGLDAVYSEYAAVMFSNEVWRESLARVPYEKRLFLMPKCLRVEEHCPAPFDSFGMLCKECGLCSIEDLGSEAERLGYAVLIAEGSAIVRAMIETNKIEAIVGVSCLNVLEKCFPHMEAVAIPGMSIPLLQDDCVNTNVDLDHVWDVLHLTSEDKTYRLDLDELRADVQGWFESAELERLMGPVRGETERIARDWLARAGKRWRPYLTVCVHMSLAAQDAEERPPMPDDLRRLAVAVECFHKASLVHDDIEDGDEQRYGEDALHVEHGLGVALNVGDFLLGEGYRLISELDVDPAAKAAMLADAARGHVTLSRGQGAELCWARAPRVMPSLEVLDVFRQKTAPAFDVALQLGAHFAGADASVREVLSAYSEALGIAYQIDDDLQDFDGKGDSNDLEDLRPSLILAIAHKRAREGDEKELMTALWERREAWANVADRAGRLFVEREVVDKARQLCDAYEQQAVTSLRTLTNPTLKGLLRRVVGKIFGNRHLIEGYCSEFEARNAASRAAGATSAR